MARKRTPEEQAAYMRDYRAKKAPDVGSDEGVTSGVTDPGAISHPAGDEPDVTPKKTSKGAKGTVPMSDRERGLPRSNYYSDHKEPGGWTETIQKLSGSQIDKILSSPGIKTSRSSRD